MDKKEQQELLQKILNVDNDPKMARVATTVFVNKATPEEAALFIGYLEHTNPAVKKIARSIIGQKALPEACDILINEFMSVVEKLTFMPDADYKENLYYQNLIEILETIFLITKSKGCTNETFFNRIDDIFKKTKNEDLRFSLIKIIGIMGDRLDYFLEIYDDLTEKERRALYYVYTFAEHPRRMEIFRKGLEDDRNFEYVIINMLNFEEGRNTLADQLLALSNYNKQTVLKKLQEGRYPNFNDVLIKMLSDKNKFLVELAIENLKNNISSDLSLEPFINLVETGYSPEGIVGALEIIAHFVKKNPEDIYLNGLEKQPSHKNKTYILDFFINQLKTSLKPSEELTEKVLPKLLVYFDTYTKEKEEMFLTIFKIIPSLVFTNSASLKSVKKRVIKFKKDFEPRLSTQFKNNLGEFVVKINQITARFEESESKIKNIAVLFDIDPHKIDSDRMNKLKSQLTEVELVEEDVLKKLENFLVTMYDESKIDWKIRSIAIELLGQYGTLEVLPKLQEAAEAESSLAVKVNAENAAKKVEERNADAIESVLVMEPLPYLQKKLNQSLTAMAFKVFNLDQLDKLPEMVQRVFNHIVLSDSLLSPESVNHLLEYLDQNLDTKVVVITASEDVMFDYDHIPNVKFLKKPFTDETLKESVS